MSLYIPDFVVGVDIETKDTLPTAQILSISASCFDVRKMQLIACCNHLIDSNDPAQISRSIGDGTMKWWERAGEGGYFPEIKAREISWGGNQTLPVALENVAKWVRQLPKGETTYTMKGPEFDYIILDNAFKQFNMWKPVFKFSQLDSVRTALRVANALGLPELSKQEIMRFNKSSQLILHTSADDASLEGYETARMYHFCHLVATIGYDKAMERVTQWQNGDFENVIERPEVIS